MPFQTGKIEAISIKALPKPDNYGNTFRSSIKVGEDWFSTGTMKKESLDVKDGGGWTQLQKGMEVEFMYSINGDFKNADKKTFSITDSSGAQPAQQRSQAPVKQQSSNVGGFVNPAMRGQAMNLAAEVLGYKESDFSDPSKIIYAIKWYLTSAKDFEALWDTAEKAIVAGNTEIPKKAPAKKAPPVVEDLYEDDEV